MSFELTIFVINILVMSEKEMNSYRLTSLEEPTDEMLTTLMKEVAEEAKRKSEEASISVSNGQNGGKNIM